MHPSFLTVSDEDLGRLNDSQLKDLMTRLVRAEMIRFNLDLSGLLAGGHQDAPDGGADVYVTWTGGPECTEFLPRRTTVFQVKATKMPASKIKIEMTSDSVARALLFSLAEAGGAYIISSNESCSLAPLQSRQSMIRSVLDDVTGAGAMAHEFYDAKRLSIWIGRYPGVALWVKETLGVGFLGWRAHGAWSADGRPGDLTFIDDDKPRAYFPPGQDGVTVAECIQRLRNHLAQPRTIARIVGLSGMGKTRIAEALFDTAVPTTVLNAGLAIYGDIAAQPAVSPMEAAERLVASGDRAVLVVDSCLPDIHRRLVGLALRPASNVSLLTIDFDVADDLPEHTMVVRVEDTSEELLDRLLRSRHPAVGFADRRAIVGFSGGNTRIAIALAVAAEQGGSLASLSDPEILTRLFLNDRRQHDPSLMRCAEAASLVYSFSAEDADGAPPELPAISAWASVEPKEMYRHIAELLERGLAQKRGPWRAVLPHAIATRLAIKALNGLVVEDVMTQLNAIGRSRLFMSFCKRVGLLHDHAKAVSIAAGMCGQDGDLGQPHDLAGHRLDAFIHIAPASPEGALTAIERSLSSPESRQRITMQHDRWKYPRLLRKIAYEPDHFRRAVRAMAVFALGEKEDENRNATRPLIESLFYIQLSGTMATPAVRLEQVREFLADQDDDVRRLGVRTLNAMMQSSHLRGSPDTDFGARSRTLGWRPATFEDVRSWFSVAFHEAVLLAINLDPLADEALAALAHQARTFATPDLFDIFDGAARRIREQRFWPKGWRSVVEALHFDGGGMDDGVRTALLSLEELLRPTTLPERYVTYVTQEFWVEYDIRIRGEPGRDHKRPNRVAQEIGTEMATRWSEYRGIIEGTLVRRSYQAWPFGMGVYLGSDDQDTVWQALSLAYAEAPRYERDSSLLGGFVRAAANVGDPRLPRWLDALSADPAMVDCVVHLNVSGGVDDAALNRLIKAVSAPGMVLGTFRAFRSVADEVDPAGLARLLEALISAGDEGCGEAIEILSMCLRHDRRNARLPDDRLVEIGSAVIRQVAGNEHYDSLHSHGLSAIAEACLSGKRGEVAARDLSRRIVQLSEEDRAYRHELDGLMTTLFAQQPMIALDELLGRDTPPNSDMLRWIRIFDDDDHRPVAPMDKVPASVLLKWARRIPAVRGPLLAQAVPYFVGADEEMEWTPVAWSLLEMSDCGVDVVNEFFRRFFVGGWSGSEAHKLMKRRRLIEALSKLSNEEVRRLAPTLAKQLEQNILFAQARERRDEGRFE